MRYRGNLWLLAPILMLAVYVLETVAKIYHPQPVLPQI